MESSVKTLKPIHILIIALFLSVCVTLVLGSFIAFTEPGIDYYGYPLAWKIVYGGVTTEYNVLNLIGDMILYTVIIFLVLYAVVRSGRKSS